MFQKDFHFVKSLESLRLSCQTGSINRRKSRDPAPPDRAGFEDTQSEEISTRSGPSLLAVLAMPDLWISIDILTVYCHRSEAISWT